MANNICLKILNHFLNKFKLSYFVSLRYQRGSFIIIVA